jgi:N4-gp56 family major capsid protein
MANTSYPVNHPLAVKLWSKQLFREVLKETFVGRFIGSDSNSMVQLKDDTQKNAGDRIRIGLRMQLTGAGVQGDSTLEGQEESLTTYTDDLFIDQLRHAVRSQGKMSEQRVTFDVRQEAMDGLRDWWADRIDTSFFNQACGNTGQSDTRYTGNQATVAASTTSGNSRIIYGPLDATTENSLSASESGSANFQLTMLDKAVNYAKTATPQLRPIRYNGGSYYVAFLHPNQVYSLKTDATAGRVTWYDATKAVLQGGQSPGQNGIFTGALGTYNNVILHESTRVPLAPSTTTVRRALFAGAQACGIGFGRGNGPNRMDWSEELFDYGNQLGVEAGCIWGLKKLIFNGNDFGTIVMASHAEAP